LTGRRLLLLFCPLLALGLYLPALRCDFVFDDRGVILMNPLLNDLRELPRLLVTSYWNATVGSESGSAAFWKRRAAHRAAVDVSGAQSGLKPGFKNPPRHASLTHQAT